MQARQYLVTKANRQEKLHHKNGLHAMLPKMRKKVNYILHEKFSSLDRKMNFNLSSSSSIFVVF